MNRLVKALTKRTLIIVWITMIIILSYIGLGFFLGTVILDKGLTIILLGAAGFVLLSESVWEGKKHKLMLKPERIGDALGLGMAVLSFIMMFGFWADVPIILNTFGPIIGEILLISAGILVWEGWKNIS